jgi:peptide/nickel transport system permease protein
MFRYILRRVLIFIPTLFAISLIAFVISINSPGDPVETLVTGSKGSGESAGVLNESLLKEKARLRTKLGLDLPLFYITMSNCASPDTFYRIYDKKETEALDRLIDRYGNWEQISNWHLSLKKMQRSLLLVKPDTIAFAQLGKDSVLKIIDETQQEVMAILASNDDVIVDAKLKRLEAREKQMASLGTANFFAPIAGQASATRQAFEAMKTQSSTWKTYIPCFHFYGYNQYHRWLFGDGNFLTGHGSKHCKGVIRGDFGISYATELDVTRTIKRAIPWSLFFTIASVLFAYLISLPIGIHAAANRGGFFDRTSSVVLFMLFSLPSFFMATLLLMTFANPDVLNWFEANGVKPVTGYPDGSSMLDKFMISLPYIVLPLICYTYSSLAFLSRTMRVAMLEVIGQDFIRTAKAKGLTYRTIIYKHGFRNALLPIITVFANIFPAAVGGSVILEYIFGIPGMGQEIINAIYTKDYPMIVCVFTLSGFMTLIGYLVADILYAMADPRITYSKK